MKNRNIVFCLLVSLLITISQDLYSQIGKLPPFRMIKANGTLFKAQNLPMGKPIIIIYFSPDCEECHKFTQDLLNRIDDYWKASIAMVTYLSVAEVKQFAEKYNLNKYPNIFVGTEGSSLFLRDYYNIQKFPYIVLFNKDGDLIKIYNSDAALEDLTKSLNAL
jgi:thioredoxin-related protein